MSKHSKANLSRKTKSKVSKSKRKSSNVRKTQAQQSKNDKLLANSHPEDAVDNRKNSQKKDDSDNDVTKDDMNLDTPKGAITGTDSTNVLSDNQNTEGLSNNKDSSFSKESEIVRLSTSDECCTITSKEPAKRKSSELFDSIHSGQVTPTLPNRSWSIHCTDAPNRGIVISEMVLHNESGIGLIPLCIKQIVFDERMNYELFLINSRIVIKNRPCIVQTIADVMHVIAYTHNVRVCMGGPEVNSYRNISLECAYKDPRSRWRHNLCTLEITDHNICESCASLEEILQKQVQRYRPQTKRKRVV